MEQHDLGWTANDQRGRVRYFWQENHGERSFAKWYELQCERKGMRSDLQVQSGKGAEVVVQPDLEPGRWYWAVRVGLTKKTMEKRQWGSKPTAEEAMAEARKVFMNWGSPPAAAVDEEIPWG